MPWNTKDVTEMREEFVLKALTEKCTMAQLCREYQISRKTGYKWLERYKKEGSSGLTSQSKCPHTHPQRTSDEDVALILETRKKYKLGGRKLRTILINEGLKDLPSEATFNRVLSRNNFVDPIESQKRQKWIRFERSAPNELWQMDFKGHFRMTTDRCHPLTVLDDHSRFNIVLKAFSGETTAFVKAALEEAFYEFGLPDQMLMDNGPPWKGSPPWILSQLTVWLMRLGIRISHSRVRHPQTQGKEERFHRTLKEELLRYHQFNNLKETQACFNEWRHLYNYVRPHQGIGMLRPFERYQISNRRYNGRLPDVEYQATDIIRKVQKCGTINLLNSKYFIGEYLVGEELAIRESEKNGHYNVYFMNTLLRAYDLGELEKKKGKLK